MTRQEFDRLMPQEFWREVVDRAAVEAPDTLLLAEAFWMLEGYFVRTLGMHRVYNSAFMNMVRDEENGKYRELMKNTLEFDPEILKRYVNFMNNPDERTAVDQFLTVHGLALFVVTSALAFEALLVWKARVAWTAAFPRTNGLYGLVVPFTTPAPG